MKILTEKLRLLVLVVFMGAAIGVSGCSTGTDKGDVSVEESDAKDRNPNEHNENGEQSQTATDSAQADDAYERVDGDKGVRDADNDGKADQ